MSPPYGCRGLMITIQRPGRSLSAGGADAAEHGRPGAGEKTNLFSFDHDLGRLEHGPGRARRDDGCV